jgi:endonuclease/exonuclease/phosphatase family metal-dependent hydrolase
MARHPEIVFRVLTWNLFHGRDAPPDPALFTWRARLLRVTERSATHAQVNRSLREEFAQVLAADPWAIALLQEAPPRWLRPLARRSHAHGASVLTSRNTGAAVRSLLASLNPDLLASAEGGSNQLLVRPPARIAEVRRLTLTRRPERRRMIWARIATPAGATLAVANLHATTGDPPAAARDVEIAAERAVAWAGVAPLVFGGDLNLRPADRPEVFEGLRERFGLSPPTAPRAIDHLLARDLEVVEVPRTLPPEAREVGGPDGLAIRLSDHAHVTAAFGMR